MADPDLHTQDPDNSSLVPIGLLCSSVSVAALLAAALAPPAQASAGEQSSLLFSLILAVVGIASLAAGLATREFARQPQEDGSLRLSARGTTGHCVVFLGGAAALFGSTLAWTGVTRTSWPLVLLACAALVACVRQAWSYLARVELELRPGEPRPGQAVAVRWRLSAPVRVIGPRAALVAEERGERQDGGRTRIERRRLYAREFDADGALSLPDTAVPSHFGRTDAIAWRLELSAELSFGPAFTLALPVRVRGAAAGDLPARDDGLHSPGGAREPAITLLGGHCTFAPGEPIAGTVTWERPTAPRHAVLRLVWHVRDTRGVVRQLAVARLPRVAEHAGDDPYRGAGEAEQTGMPLAASERRRFHLVAPEAPASYVGALFRIDWYLELEVDGETHRIDLVLGPRRAALTHDNSPPRRRLTARSLSRQPAP